MTPANIANIKRLVDMKNSGLSIETIATNSGINQPSLRMFFAVLKNLGVDVKRAHMSEAHKDQCRENMAKARASQKLVSAKDRAEFQLWQASRTKLNGAKKPVRPNAAH